MDTVGSLLLIFAIFMTMLIIIIRIIPDLKRQKHFIQNNTEYFLNTLKQIEIDKVGYLYKNRGIDIMLKKTYVDSSSDSFYYQVELIVKINSPVNGSMKITNRSLSNFLKKDILTGDDKFDKYFHITSFFSPFVSAILANNIRIQIMNLSNYFKQIEIDSKKMNFLLIKPEKITSLKYDYLFSQLILIADEIEKASSFKDAIKYSIDNDPSEKVKILCINRAALLPIDKKEIYELVKDYLNNSNDNISLAACKTSGEYGFPILEKFISNFAKYNSQIQNQIASIILKNNYPLKMEKSLILFNSSHENETRILLLNSFEKTIDNTKLSFLIRNIAENAENNELDIILEYCKKFGNKEHIILLRDVFDLKNNPYILKVNKVYDAIHHIQDRLGPVEKGWISVDDSDPLNGALSSNSSEKGKLSKGEL